MKAETLKRLFSALERGNPDQITKVAEVIVEEERSKNHGNLADQLQRYLSKMTPTEHKAHGRISPNLTPLPTNKRSAHPLIQVVERDLLNPHMILNEAIESRFIRIEKEFAAQERLASFGLKPKKKILIYGPPGCGKTMGAERLAWNLGLPLHKVRLDALVSSYLGDSMSNLRAIFDHAAQMPRLLLLDECDFVAKSRELGQDVGEINRMVNTLLQLLEEYHAPGLLVATTNLDKSLDGAIFRRFDDVFEIPHPDEEQIVKLLKQRLSSMDTAKNISWKILAENLKGSSCARIVHIANEAAKIAVLGGKSVVQSQDIEQAMSEVRLA